MHETWEEGSHLGKYAGAGGGGTYFYEPLTDTLSDGHYNGKIQLP